mmetsp:Transcript_3864/g.8063  ORF Transcript_3864/g.8063 Transcript_3864/m.8063 type:complete len:240 (-) Transcript_3864:770-1489(-)
MDFDIVVKECFLVDGFCFLACSGFCFACCSFPYHILLRLVCCILRRFVFSIFAWLAFFVLLHSYCSDGAIEWRTFILVVQLVVQHALIGKFGGFGVRFFHCAIFRISCSGDFLLCSTHNHGQRDCGIVSVLLQDFAGFPWILDKFESMVVTGEFQWHWIVSGICRGSLEFRWCWIFAGIVRGSGQFWSFGILHLLFLQFLEIVFFHLEEVIEVLLVLVSQVFVSSIGIHRRSHAQDGRL